MFISISCWSAISFSVASKNSVTSIPIFSALLIWKSIFLNFSDGQYSDASFSAFSIGFWINPDALSGTQGIIGKATSSVAGEYYIITVGSDLYFRLVDNSVGNAFIGRYKTSALSTGSWQYVVMTYSGSGASSGIKMYINNTQKI